MHFKTRILSAALLLVFSHASYGASDLLARTTENTTTTNNAAAFSQSITDDITAVITKQQAAWNAGDIDGFMQGYWKSEELTFSSGGQVTRGWQATIERYKSRYTSRDLMGTLTFSELEVTLLGDEAALVLGRWKLDRDAPVEGNFSLVFRKLEGQWLIIHDHTSVSE